MSTGGLENYLDCDDVDLRYLEEVIMKVKEGFEGQYQLGDILEAALMEFDI